VSAGDEGQGNKGGGLKAAGKESDSGSKKPVGSNKEECPLKDEKPKIVSIEFLDGDDKKVVSGEADHYVNIPRDAKWVSDATIKNIDRMGQKARVKVSFNKPGKHGFKAKLVADSGNLVYTDDEKSRNPEFKYEEAEKHFTTDGNGDLIIADYFSLSAGGADKYTLSATDDYGTPEVKSKGTLKTARFFYYAPIKMKDLTSVASSTSTLEGEYAKHKIKMVPVTVGDIDRIHNIGDSAGSTNFKNKARIAYAASDAAKFSPYVIAVGYTDHLAVKNPAKTMRKTGVQVGPGHPTAAIRIVGAGLKTADINPKHLWQDLVPNEGWYVSAKFLKDGGTAGTDDVTITEDKITPKPWDASVPSKCCDVEIDVSGLPDGQTGTITLKVNWVDRMRAGLSMGSGNMVCICTRAWWGDTTTAEQNQVMIHEIGHQYGMVADGTGKLPDKVAKYYSGKGHVGGHCHAGLAVLASYNGVSGSDCVMFGATNGKTAFCADCSPAVKKLDLSAGRSNF